VVELEAAIAAYITSHNAFPKPFNLDRLSLSTSSQTSPLHVSGANEVRFRLHRDVREISRRRFFMFF
jgi:hypothetical protein